MDQRLEELKKLKTFTEGIDNELTMILQSLQWDRKELLRKPGMATCKYDSNHKLPPDKTEEHEKECFLRQNGYTKDNQLLPDPLDPESNTLVKLSKEDIKNIIGNASRLDPAFKKGILLKGHSDSDFNFIGLLFKALNYKYLIFFLNKGMGCREAEPMSLERLQEVYSADERRAIYDAVVSAVPSCHDLTDLALLSRDDQGAKKVLSRMEILLELRNMRRRRTKYRVAAKTRNYSDVLRDVIKTQMEHYSEGKTDQRQHENVDKTDNQKYHHSESSNSMHAFKDDDKKRYEQRSDFPRPMMKVEVKTEREGSIKRERDYSRERPQKRSDKHDRHSDRYKFDDRSRERSLVEDLQTSDRSLDESRKRRHHKHSDKHKHKERITDINFQKSNEKRKGYGSDTEYDHEKRYRKSHKHRHFYHEAGHEEDHHGENERRFDEKRDKTKQKNNTEMNYDDYQYTDRGRSSVAQDKRYEGRSGEKVHNKQERDESTSRDYRSRRNKIESRDRRHDEARHEKSYRDASTERYSSQRSPKQEKYYRYYDRPSEEFYDPNKKTKSEK